MRLVLIALAILLTGCTTVVPVTQKFPEPPGLMATHPCSKLNMLDEGADLVQVSKTVATNYNEYWNCKIKLDAWIEWYQKQDLIYRGFK